MRYNPVTNEVVEALRTIAGAANVITDREAMEGYAHDEMVRRDLHYPEVVVTPVDEAAVAGILRLASERLIPVTPRGAGTGLSGGAVPLFGGISLSLERMDRIIEIDQDNFTATVEPGVTLERLTTAVEEKGLYYPLYPGEKAATIGGNVATNAGGMRAVKYGVTRHFVLGLEAVLPSGEIVRSGGKFVKCSTGYDLTQLLAGSEGTLAVITRVILRLMTPPGKRELLFVPFRSLHEAIGVVPRILRSGILPVGIEFLERDIVTLQERYSGREMPLHDHAAFLLIIVEAEDEARLLDVSQRLSEMCRDGGAVDTMVPGSERARRALLEAREKFYPAVRSLGMVELADVVVPRSRIADFVGRVKELCREHGLPVIAYGHAGDGNVHLHPFGVNMDRTTWERQCAVLFSEIFRAGVALGGTISGEHGLGYDKKQYLRMAVNESTLKVMSGIKKAFDPNGIMNPGKVFDLD